MAFSEIVCSHKDRRDISWLCELAPVLSSDPAEVSEPESIKKLETFCAAHTLVDAQTTKRLFVSTMTLLGVHDLLAQVEKKDFLGTLRKSIEFELVSFHAEFEAVQAYLLALLGEASSGNLRTNWVGHTAALCKSVQELLRRFASLAIDLSLDGRGPAGAQSEMLSKNVSRLSQIVLLAGVESLELTRDLTPGLGIT